MKFSSAIAGLLATFAAVATAAPQQKGEGYISSTRNGAAHNATAEKEFIIILDKDHRNATMEALFSRVEADGTKLKYEFENSQFKGVVAVMGDHCANAFSAMAEVAMIEEKVEIQTFFTQKTGAPWGLQRISNEAGASGSPTNQNFTYSFEDQKLGAGVDIYVIDTGARVSHAIFKDRITAGFSAFGSVADGDGHGTHVAGTAAGTKFGVAQGANIIAVKVLGDDGSGSSADTIAGMSWVIEQHDKRKSDPNFKGSIMSMSWGLQGTARSVDNVVLMASEAGIHVSVAAGNDGADACLSTPSHNGGANSNVVSVGSVNIRNEVSTFSNIGECVDIYAPGEEILSAWASGDNVINFLSGTSMACPHVSGVMAYLIAEDTTGKLGQDPAALKAKLLSTARANAFTGNLAGSDNLLLSNGVDGKVASRPKRLMRNWVVPSRRSSGGSGASKARDAVMDMEKRWALHSEESALRY
jgi:cerevisin